MLSAEVPTRRTWTRVVHLYMEHACPQRTRPPAHTLVPLKIPVGSACASVSIQATRLVSISDSVTGVRSLRQPPAAHASLRCIGTACIEGPPHPAHQTGRGKGLRNRFHHAQCAAVGASSAQATRGMSRGCSACGQGARIQTCGARLTRTSRYRGHAGKEGRRLRRTRARERAE